MLVIIYLLVFKHDSKKLVTRKHINYCIFSNIKSSVVGHDHCKVWAVIA